jgi:putative FmdB family regulatory protein
MPTYEFRCPDGHEFEKFYRKISDAVSELPCPECGKTALRQISGGSALLFKGSGFYLTDYGKNAHRKAAPASDSGASEGSSEKKGGEAKPTDASDAKPAKPAGQSGDAKADATKAAPTKPASGTKKTES